MKPYSREQYAEEMYRITKNSKFIKDESFDCESFRIVKNIYENNYITYWIFEYIDMNCVPKNCYEITKNEYEILFFVFNKTR